MAKDREPTASTFYGRLQELRRRTDERSRSIVHRLGNRLAVGLLVAFPLVITVIVARFLFNVLDTWFRPISRRLFDYEIFGVGMIISVLFLLALGFLATNVFGSRLLNFFERRISKIPLLSPIYLGARQITEAIQIRGSTEFRRVVMLEFPHSRMRSIGFVTREFPAGTRFAAEATAMVFVPTTPNPTSGFLVVVKQKDLLNLDITVEEGVKLVISGGLLTPETLIVGGPGPTAYPRPGDLEISADLTADPDEHPRG